MNEKRRGFIQHMLGYWLDPEEVPIALAGVPPQWGKEPVSVLWEGEPLECRLIGGELWFTAASVCKAAGIDNVSQALSRLEGDEKRDDIITNDAIGRRQLVWWVNMAGFFSLVLTSRMPEARQLKRFVARELLPSIQQYGCYPPPGEEVADQTPVRKWVRVAGTKHMFPPMWMKIRQQSADQNVSLDPKIARLGGGARAKAIRYDAIYLGAFNAKARPLKQLINCRDKDGLQSHMDILPLSITQSASGVLSLKVDDGSVTIENLAEIAEAIGRAFRQAALGQLDPGYDFLPTEDAKGNKVLGIVRALPASA